MEGELPKKAKGRPHREERDAFTDAYLQAIFNPEAFTKRPVPTPIH